MNKKIWFYALLLILFSGILYAQIDSRGLKVKLRSQAGKRWAICIGIDKYVDKKLNTLKKAANDAHGLGDILKGNGDFDVSVFSDKDKNGNEQSFSSNFFPTKRNIENHLSSMIEMGDIKSNDLVVFSFSGHGISDAKGNGYLLPLDWDSGSAYESAIPVSTIVAWLKQAGVTKSLVLIDACREEMSPSRSVDTMKRLYEEKFQSANVSAIFFATKQGGFSYEDPGSDYGAFTKFLINGLRGNGDINKDTLVTFRELSTFVEDSLSAWARDNGLKQRPYIGPIGEQSGDLALTIASQQQILEHPRENHEEPKKEQPAITGKQIPFSTKKDADIAPEVVYIPAGEFMMGSNNDDSSKPVHRVKVDAFYIGKYEVTQRDWIAVMGSNPSKFKGDNLPVESVSWNDIHEYLQKLSSLTGKRWRLPTEAEWEYACRAGSTTDYCFGNDELQLGEYAWYDKNSGEKAHPVGQKKPNAWGLYDMHGNVLEWCQDWYDEKYYANSPLTNPLGPASGSLRVLRGGSWRYYGDLVGSALRIAIKPGSRLYVYGFRCLQEPSEEPKKEQPVISGKPVPFSTKKDADIAPEVVYIPAGEFMMGSGSGEDDEKPVHRVKVDAFYIGKYEVTQREWVAVMGSNPSNFKGDDLPVEQVSWDDIQEYLKKLSSITGKRCRLTTEAEWEYACRAGSTTKYCFGDNETQSGEYAWYSDNSGEKTHPVGQKKPNAWGLYDMHGNVWEWCHDWYDKNYYANSPLTNPMGPASGNKRLCRGGSWYLNADWLRSASRDFPINPTFRLLYVGFRCLQEP